MLAEKWKIELFLKSFQAHWPPKCFVVPRKEYKDTLSELGLTPQQCQDIILSLTCRDYVAGPKPDRDKSGEIWEFGKKIGDIELYIKLKVFTVENGQVSAKCISFHKANWKPSYPFK